LERAIGCGNGCSTGLRGVASIPDHRVLVRSLKVRLQLWHQERLHPGRYWYVPQRSIWWLWHQGHCSGRSFHRLCASQSGLHGEEDQWVHPPAEVFCPSSPKRARARSGVNLISKLLGMFSAPPTVHQLEMGKKGIFLPGI
jgi:hypothetical protein